MWAFLRATRGGVARLLAVYALAAAVLALPTALVLQLHESSGWLPLLIGHSLRGALVVPYLFLCDLLGLGLITFSTALGASVLKRGLRPWRTFAAFAVARAVSRFALVVALMFVNVPFVGAMLLGVFGVWAAVIHASIVQRVLRVHPSVAVMIVASATALHLAVLVAVG